MFSTARTPSLRAEGGAMGHGNTGERFVLCDKATGEGAVVSGDDVVRIVGVEIDYIAQTICEDGEFENGKWRVRMRRSGDQC